MIKKKLQKNIIIIIKTINLKKSYRPRVKVRGNIDNKKRIIVKLNYSLQKKLQTEGKGQG